MEFSGHRLNPIQQRGFRPMISLRATVSPSKNASASCQLSSRQNRYEILCLDCGVHGKQAHSAILKINQLINIFSGEDIHPLYHASNPSCLLYIAYNVFQITMAGVRLHRRSCSHVLTSGRGRCTPFLLDPRSRVFKRLAREHLPSF